MAGVISGARLGLATVLQTLDHRLTDRGTWGLGELLLWPTRATRRSNGSHSIPRCTFPKVQESHGYRTGGHLPDVLATGISNNRSCYLSSCWRYRRRKGPVLAILAPSQNRGFRVLLDPLQAAAAAYRDAPQGVVCYVRRPPSLSATARPLPSGVWLNTTSSCRLR